MSVSTRSRDAAKQDLSALNRGRKLLFDYVGVVGPRRSWLRSVDELDGRRRLFLSERTGIPPTPKAEQEFRNRMEVKYGTRETSYILEHEYQIPRTEYVSEVYLPVMPKIRDEIERRADKRLSRLLRAIPLSKSILSNTLGVFVRTGLEAQRLNSHFEFVITVDTLMGDTKPNPSAFEKMVRSTGYRPKEVIYFDDKKRNLDAAHGLGMITVHIGGDCTPGLHQADYHFDTLRQALEAIRRMQSEPRLGPRNS